jgi:hypothetical protein
MSDVSTIQTFYSQTTPRSSASMFADTQGFDFAALTGSFIGLKIKPESSMSTENSDPRSAQLIVNLPSIAHPAGRHHESGTHPPPQNDRVALTYEDQTETDEKKRLETERPMMYVTTMNRSLPSA